MSWLERLVVSVLLSVASLTALLFLGDLVLDIRISAVSGIAYALAVTLLGLALWVLPRLDGALERVLRAGAGAPRRRA